MNRPRTVSAAIHAQPEQFSLDSLVSTANALLRDQPGSPEQTDSSAVALYLEQRLIDAPEVGDRPYGRRHLMQLVAIQTLRSMHFGTERIRTLVHGVDDDYLRLLCDDPVEAEKKAAVMSNWLNMLKKGRVGRPGRGETAHMNAPEPEPVRHFAPAAEPAPVRKARHGVAPALQGLAGLGAPPPPPPPPRDLPTQQPPLDLPDAPLQKQPQTRPLRPPRATMAASRSLNDALREQLGPDLNGPPEGATPQFPVGSHLPRRQVTVSSGPGADTAPTAAAPKLPPVESWTRLQLADGVELHTRTVHHKLSEPELAALFSRLRALLGE